MCGKVKKKRTLRIKIELVPVEHQFSQLYRDMKLLQIQIETMECQSNESFYKVAPHDYFEETVLV